MPWWSFRNSKKKDKKTIKKSNSHITSLVYFERSRAMSLSRRLNTNTDKKADESSADTDNVVRQLKLLSRSQTALLKVILYKLLTKQ
jgi:hypothetical protein